MNTAQVIADRYRLDRLLGRGGSGAVWLAHDAQTDGPVAVKLLAMAVDADLGQLARELAALDTLDVPGVARLLDHGTADGRPFLVLEYVDGAPFPGPFGGDWERLAVPTTALLHTLGAMHAAGVVHRDLKPENVLVDAQGRPTVLDFGLARVGAGQHTRSGMVLGTPAWQAPEQMMGEICDARTDLYAVGLMLFAAIAGEPAHAGTDPQALMWQRLMEAPPSLAARAPHAPEHVAAVVDRLLAQEPGQRPASAEAVLSGLAAAQRVLPELGDPSAWQAVRDALCKGRGISVGGPAGSGRSWCLARAAQVLDAEGRTVHRLPPGEGVFESLGALLPIESLAGDGAAALPSRIEAALAEHITGETVIIADAGVDPWTSEILGRTPGAIARVVDGPADVTLRPWTEAELRPLFAGPDLILHLQTDGARALFRRTGGLQRRIVEQVRQWVAGRIARWTERGLYVSREMLLRLASRPATLIQADQAPPTGALGRLTAWLHLCWPHTGLDVLDAVIDQPRWAIEVMLASLVQRGVARQLDDGRYEPRVPASVLQSWPESERLAARRRIAAALPAGVEGRLAHVQATGTRQAIVMEVLHQARRLADLGRVSAAVGLVLDTLESAADDERYDLELHAVELANREQSPDLQRQVAAAIRAPALKQLIDGIVEVGSSQSGPAMAALEADAPHRDGRLEWLRSQLRFVARLRTGRIDAADAFLESVAVEAAGASPVRAAQLADWRGLLAYQKGDFIGAARMHGQAALTPARRLKSSINQALALMEGFELADAARIAASVLDEARSRRLALIEAFAWRLLRSARYRQATADAPHEALVEAALHAVPPRLAALIGLTEAAFAWRKGLRTVSALAAPARALRGTAVATLARALEPSSEDVEALAREALTLRFPRISLQVLGLLALHGASADAWAERVRAYAQSVPRVHWDARLEIISVREALDACGTAPALTQGDTGT